ncbi:MAG: 2-oxo acid dehydrogenase subunit E2, partial [Deltaproteobacteria bacterium]
AVIQPPQAAILAVGAIVERPVVRGGLIAFGPVVSLTLSGDHRLVDVVAGAAFLAEVRRRLEEPRLLLGSHV